MKKNKVDRYLIYTLLIIIIILTSILIYKESKRPEYDIAIYEKVYEEYNEIVKDIKDETNNEKYKEEKQETRIKENNIKITAGILEIKKIGLFSPIIDETTNENLKVAPTKLYGPNANDVGNFCIVGHNYHNDEHFSRLKELKQGDMIELTDKKGRTFNYSVYDKYEIFPKDLNCLSQKTNGKREVTLITCTNDSKRRLVIKCIQN